jgi:DNA modification methylase
VIYNEDCIQGMKKLDDLSIGLIVTSPPYWSIKQYSDSADEIGSTQTFDEYLASINTVLQESYRVLGPGCRMAINIGDQYLRAADHERYRVLPIPAFLTTMGLSAGFDYMGGILWNKISTTKTSGGCSFMGSIYYPKDGHVTYEHEFILLFKKSGKVVRPCKNNVELSKLTKEERSSWFRGVWSDVRPTKQDNHPAAFPVELPRRLIKMYSYFGETVLDMFMGSGSTAVAATMEGRQHVGYEINPEFCKIAEERLNGLSL